MLWISISMAIVKVFSRSAAHTPHRKSSAFMCELLSVSLLLSWIFSETERSGRTRRDAASRINRSTRHNLTWSASLSPLPSELPRKRLSIRECFYFLLFEKQWTVLHPQHAPQGSTAAVQCFKISVQCYCVQRRCATQRARESWSVRIGLFID